MSVFTKTRPVKAPPAPLTRAQLIDRHRAAALDFLARSKKAGRLEAQAVHASQAGAHATLALSYIMDEEFSRSSVLLVPEASAEDAPEEESADTVD